MKLNAEPQKPNLERCRQAFFKIGWFIPAYAQMSFYRETAEKIESAKNIEELDLESIFLQLYSPDHLAAMLLHRYTEVPEIFRFRRVIHESIQAHFAQMHRVSICGILSCIEGITLAIGKNRGLNKKFSSQLFEIILEDVVKQINENNIGIIGEYHSALKSFEEFARKIMFVNSEARNESNGIARNSIFHGVLGDEDYGDPLDFYRCISTIDFLCLISSFKNPTSMFAPSPTEQSMRLAEHYMAYSVIASSSQSIQNKIFDQNP